MIQRHEFDSVMRTWFLEDAAGPQPQRVLLAALAQTGARRPRPEWLVRLRRGGTSEPQAPSVARFQVVAVGIVVLTLLAALVFAAASIGGRGPDRSVVGLTATATIPALASAPGARASQTPAASPGATDPTSAPAPSPSAVVSGPGAMDHGVFTSAGTDLLGGAAASLQVQLPDGRVLMAGFGGPDHSRVEIYDPQTGKFIDGGHLLERRDTGPGTAVALADGRVLFEGGTGIGYGGSKHPWSVLSSAELYDPATGTSTPTGEMTTPRTRGSATRLLDGRVLVAGGDPTGNDLPWSPGMNLAEIFDPATGAFTPTGPMNRPRADPATAVLPDGRVLVVGGVPHSAGVPTAEVYDPVAGTWTMTGSMHPLGESYFGEPSVAVPLRDGRVVVVEGAAGSTLQVPFDAQHRLPKPAVSTVLEAYDPVQNAFTKLGSTTTGRIGASVTVLADGRLLIAGGFTTPFLGTLGTDCCIWELDPDASAEVFDPATNVSVATGSMRSWRAGHAAFLLPDGDAFVFGGNGGHRAELFHP